MTPLARRRKRTVASAEFSDDSESCGVRRARKPKASSEVHVPPVPTRTSVGRKKKKSKRHRGNNAKRVSWHSSALARKKSSLSLSFSSKRVRTHGYIDDQFVREMTIDTASDVTCVSLSYLKRHPTLSFAHLEPIPSSSMNLSGPDGSPMQILGFISFTVRLGTISRRVDALVVPCLGPDQILLDNDVMSGFGAVLDWDNEQLTFKSNDTVLPALHRKTSTDRSPQSSTFTVAAVAREAEEHTVSLRRRYNIRPGHEIIVRAYAETQPSNDTTVVIEPRLLTADEISSGDFPIEFERVIVARTLTTWNAKDGSVYLQVANPSSEHLALHANLEIGTLSPVAIVEPEKLRVHAVAATPKTVGELAAAREELAEPLKKAFTNSTFSREQQARVLDLCAKYRPVFSLNSSELGKCTTAEATFPMPPNTKPVSRRPYRANPRAEAVINKCVKDMLSGGIIEELPSPWGSPVTIVARKDGQPRFCVDYRTTLNKLLIRKTWPMANMESNLDSVGSAQFISVADVQSAYWQIPVHPDHIERTAFVTNSGKYCYRRMPFGVCNAPWIFTEMAHKTLGHIPELLIYMDDFCVLSATFENHLKSLESMFVALQAAGLTLKPSKVAFGPKSIEYLGHIITKDGVSVGKDRIEAIQKLPTPTCIKDLRSVLGVVNFVRRFIPDYAEVTAPLVALTQKEYATKSRFQKAWNSNHDIAFAHIKRLLVSAPVLHFPDFSREFVVHVDASETGCGAFLAQISKDDDKSCDIIAYYSHRFKHGQKHYSASMKECCGVVHALAHWRPYLFGRHFTVMTDHQALTHLYYMQDTSNMLTRWAIALQNFDFTVKHVPGKLNVVPDALSRLFGEIESEPLAHEPVLASICRNVPSDRPYHPPGPRDYEISAESLNEIDVVQNDTELFASAVSLFPVLDHAKLREEQDKEYRSYIDYVKEPATAALPSGESKSSMSKYFLNEAVLFRSYLPGYLRKNKTFRDQLVVPCALRDLILHECHDAPSSGGHLAFKATYDRLRDRFWWPSMSKDVAEYIKCCLSCQHRKTSRRSPPLPVGHRPVDRPFQCVAIDLVEYKSVSKGCKYVLSVIDHLTRFLILVPVPNKRATTIAQALVEHVFSVFSPPETLHSDQGTEFENELVKELQAVFGFRKTRTSAYRPQGNSVLERVHSTLHNMLAMYANAKFDNWADLLPFVQLAHNTAYNQTLEETPHYLMFGRRALLPVDVILGLPSSRTDSTRLDYSRRTVENLQLAYEIVRRNMKERTDKQAESNEKLTVPQFEPGEQVLVHRPHTVTDGPNPKLISPWHGPFTVRSKVSPVIYRVSKDGELAETTVHLARMKKYFALRPNPVPDFSELDEMFLGQKIPIPDLDGTVFTVKINGYPVEGIGDFKRGKGQPSVNNFQYLFLLKDKPPALGIWRHFTKVPQCHDMIRSYRAQILVKDPRAFDRSSDK